jgi:hypothetical protein
MRQLAIIAQAENDTERQLSECVERLANAGVWVYATHRGRGYAVIWADDHLLDRDTRLLRDAGLEVAPLTHNRSPQIRTPAPPAGVSNQNSRMQSPPQTPPEEIEGAMQRANDSRPLEYMWKGGMNRAPQARKTAALANSCFPLLFTRFVD